MLREKMRWGRVAGDKRTMEKVALLRYSKVHAVAMTARRGGGTL